MINNILFDFDGVIVDSMDVRRRGFKEIFNKYSNSLVEKLLEFHDINGGLSRYEKIRFFYRELLNEKVTENDIQVLANNFSIIMKKELIKKRYLIPETLEFLKNNYKGMRFHVVSGSDEKELKYLCKRLGISNLFISMHGSPVHKTTLVRRVIEKNRYNKEDTLLIGDSINDYDAALANGIEFYGYNNDMLKQHNYISSMSNLSTIVSKRHAK